VKQIRIRDDIIRQYTYGDFPVGIVTELRARLPRNWGSISCRGNIFFSSPLSRSALGPIQPPVQWVPGALNPGIKRPGCDADQ
jgi:hypothetical protein